MTMISRKDFTSSDYRLFMLPAFTRAFLFKSSPLGELSYNIKIAAEDKKSSAACASNRTSARFYKAGFLQGSC